jgi:hypothetical protein
VYADVHLYLAEAKGSGIGEWLSALDSIEKLEPSAVVAGHKRDSDADSPENIGGTRPYIEDFPQRPRFRRPLRGSGRPLPGPGEPRRSVELGEVLHVLKTRDPLQPLKRAERQR